MLEHVLDNLPIFITDQAQLVGYWGSAPNVGWSPPSFASALYTQPNVIPDPEEESLKILAEVGDYWDKHSYERPFYDTIDLEDLQQ